MSPHLISSLQPFATALAIGLVIGIERESSHPPGQQPLGSRTFVLFSLLGALAARLKDPIIGVALSIFVGAVVIAGYLRSSKNTETEHDIGFTTEVAAVLTYGLGFLANTEAFLAIIIGVITLVVLSARKQIHIFSRDKLKPKELQASVVLLVLSTVVIPFLPNDPIDAWGFFNPQHFGILIFIILVLQFAAYLSIRILGPSLGILLLGFLGGFVSSTSLTATIAKKSKHGEIHPIIGACAVTLACSGMFLLVLIILLVTSFLLAIHVIPSLLISGLCAGIFALFLSQFVVESHYIPRTSNPLAIFSALKMAAFLACMLFFVTSVKHLLGPNWLYAATFLAGFIEIRGVTLAIATLHHLKKITTIEGLNLILTAISASFITKAIIISFFGKKRFAIYTGCMLCVMLLITVSIWFIQLKI